MFNKRSKIYVAGHTGLIGSAVIALLKKEGYQQVIVRTEKELDLIDQRKTSGFFVKEKPEYVFFCAGLNAGIFANRAFPAKFFHVNICMQDNVLQACRNTGVENVVFYGSSCMYPRDCHQPMAEESLLGGRPEQTSLAYAVAKISGIVQCSAYNAQDKNRRFIALVPNSVYGPNDNFDPEYAHVLSALIARIHSAKIQGKRSLTLWGSGKVKREFIFCSDVAAASLFAIRNSRKLVNTHYNVGTGADYSIRELAKLISKIVGFKGEIKWDISKPDGSPRKLLDSRRFRELGWRPLVGIEQGLQLTYDWYLNNL
jgi:GDP-L-fucose synthase